MRMSPKILWGEGIFLRPQHFQQQDQYHEARLHRAASALHPYLWGVGAVEWDLDGLRTNTLRLYALNAMFADGEMIDAPAGDALPPPFDLSTLPAAQQEFTFYAALPALTSHGVNCAAPAQHNSGVRYAHSERSTADLYTQAAEADISYLKKTPRLLAETEPRGAYACFALIKIRRLVSGGFEPAPGFMPPSLSIGATPRLQQMLGQLLEALLAKADALHGHHREPSKNVIEFRSGDVSSFWLLHTVSCAAATLMHYLRHPALHPERLFEALLGLAGGLMSYSKVHALPALPSYEHALPGPGFETLNHMIRDLLDTVISSKYFSIALAETKPSYHLGQLDSGKIDLGSTLYLAVRAAMPAIELVEVVPLRIKVGAPDDVDKCVLSALPGVRLQHAPQVPAAIPVRPDTHYFSLDNRGPLYEHMLKAQSISVYAPGGIAELELELIAVAA